MTIKLVAKKYVGTSTLRFILGWAGVKTEGPFEYIYSDGYRFRPYPRGTLVKDEDLVARGCTDPTGMKFQPYVDAAGLGKGLPKGHYINWLELDRK